VYDTLGRNNDLHDYGHVNMLTHRDAERDHFPRILQWIHEKEEAAGGRA
jgi:hypothetical protein